MKKGSKILSFLLSCVIAIGSMSFSGIKVSAASEVLFEEYFETNTFNNTTTYNGKEGTWTRTSLNQNNDADNGRIYPNAANATGSAKFMFTEKYAGNMVLRVDAEVEGGGTGSNGRVDIMSADTARVTLCRFTDGNIYINTNGNHAVRDTGLDYTAGTRYIFTGIIDQENKTFEVSIYDKTNDVMLLENYNVTPYKNSKSNWTEMVDGFIGMEFSSTRGASGQNPFYLYGISVRTVTPWEVDESDITLKDASGTAQDWSGVDTSLKTVAIDFGEAMDEATLSANTVYVENATTKAKVAATGSYSNNIYTLTLTEELASNTAHNIVITSDVATLYGGKNSENQSYSFTTKVGAVSLEEGYLFKETFEDGYADITNYGGKTGAWSASDGNGLLQNSNDNEGKIYENRNEVGGMQFKFDDGQEYTEAMVLEVEADILTGPVDKADRGRVDIIGSIESDGHHRITLCSFSGGKIYANTMNNGANYDTGATYQAGTRYIVTGIIDEANESFTLTVKEKDTDVVVLDNYAVPNYKHEKSNWQKMTKGFKGVCFYADRSGNGSPAYSLYSLSVKKVADPWEVEQSDITLKDAGNAVQAWGSVATNLKTVAIDFGVAMNSATLTNDTVYVENASTGAKVAATGSYSNNVYTLTLTEELVAGATYNVVITDGAKTTEGGVNSVSYGFDTAAPADGNILFEETFEEGYKDKTTYNGKTGAWSNSEGDNLLWNYDGGEGKIYANRAQAGGMQFILADGQEYTKAMVLEVTADVLTGSITTADHARIDIIGSIEADGHHRITLCSLVNGKIYVNCIGAADARDTGATYEAGKRYIVKGLINEAGETFTLSVYDKETGNAILENYNVDPYKHNKSNWQKMTAGFKGINFYANRKASGSPAYSLYSLTVKEMPFVLDINKSNITLADNNDAVQPFEGASILTSKITINFGAPMKASTLNDNNIYIVNASTGKKVAYSSTYEGNKYVMELASALDSETTYNIVITEDVKGEDNVTIENTVTIPFTTGEGGNIIEEDSAFNSTFGFDNLDGWTQTGKRDITATNGMLTVPVSSTGDRALVYTYNPIYENNAVFEVNFDIYPGDNTTTRIQLDGKSGYIVLTNFNGGAIYANTYTTENPTGATYVPGELYKVKCVIDQNENILSVWVYDKNGSVVVEKFEDAPFGGNNGRGQQSVGLKSITISNNVQATGGNSTKIDNLTVTEILSAPVVSADSISIGIMGGETATNFKNVNPASNVVKIGFGTVLNTATITNESIQILKNGTPVATTLAYADRTVTVIINEVLSANSDYTIKISDTIANVNGVAMKNSVDVQFSTGVATTSATLRRLSVNGNTVENVSQIVNGDNLVVEIDYMNSTAEDKELYVVVAGYNDNALVTANYITKLVDKSITSSTVRVESGAFNTEGVEEIMVMLWDGFDTMHPLSPSLVIK